MILRRRRVFRAAAPQPAQQLTALVFPSNNHGGTPTPAVRFELVGSAAPDIVPLTVMVKVWSIDQQGYNTNFFHARNSTEAWSSDNKYWGAHLYPVGGGDTTEEHNHEISVAGTDYITGANAQSTAPVYSQWTSQVSSAQNTSGSASRIDYYYRLPDTNHLISWVNGSGILENAVANKALIFGGAPWSQTGEHLSGRLRGIQVYQSIPTLEQKLALAACETDAQVLAYVASESITGLWYLCMNPTPDDVTDKSGNGHHPTWINANRPTLWEG